MIPGQALLFEVTGPELQLTFDGDFPGRTIEVDSATLPNFQDSATYEAQYVAYLVATLGEPDATTFQQPCPTNPSSDQIAAATAAHAAMDPAFQDHFEALVPSAPPFTDCFQIQSLQQYFRGYWFPYAWGTENPVTFALATVPAAAPIVIEPTFTG